MESYFFEYKKRIYQVDFVLVQKSLLRLKFYPENGVIKLKVPIFAKREDMIGIIEKHKISLAHMLDRSLKTDDDSIYIFGEKHRIISQSNFNTIEGIGNYRDEIEKDKLLTRTLYRYLDQRFYKIKDIMMITKDYKYSIRKMKSRYGTNSRRTYKICFSLDLIHFSPEIIDSVIVHEFAHDYYFDHSDKFYEIVYHFCPNYDELRRKMVKGQFR